MASVNKVMLMGNLTRDPEIKYTPSGSAVCNLGIASNRKYKKGDEMVEDVTFADVEVWGSSAENCSKYLKKGSPVFIEGRLKFSTWEKDGEKRSKLSVVAENVQFLGSGTDQRVEHQGESTPEQSKTVNPDDIPF